MSRKSYKFKLFFNKKKFRRLQRNLYLYCEIYNHCIKLIRLYFKIFKKHLTKNKLQKHLKKLIDLGLRPLWKGLDAQARQEVTDRIYKSYQAFFKWAKTKKGGKKSPPKLKKFRKYKSFTLKQAGWKVDKERCIVFIQGIPYRFNETKKLKDSTGKRTVPWFQGTIKTVTLKKDSVGDWYVIFSCELKGQEPKKRLMTGKMAGFDFGLKTFLVSSENKHYHVPEFFKKSIKELKKRSKELSSKERGSKNRAKARKALARLYRHIANQRNDFNWKLTLDLIKEFDFIFLEDLNFKGMQRLWGRKISDISPSEFFKFLECRAQEYGSIVHKIDRFFPSTKTCSNPLCGHVKKAMSLKERTFVCEVCGLKIDRDFNASLNIKSEGMSSLGLDRVRQEETLATVA